MLWANYHVAVLPPGGAMLPPICLPSDPPGPIKPPAPSRPLLRDLESPAVPCGLPPAPSPALQGLTTPLLGSLLGGEGTTSGVSDCELTLIGALSTERARGMPDWLVPSSLLSLILCLPPPRRLSWVSRPKTFPSPRTPSSTCKACSLQVSPHNFP